MKIIDLSISIGDDMVDLEGADALGLRCRPGGSYGCTGDTTDISCIGRSVRRFVDAFDLRASVEDDQLEGLRAEVTDLVKKFAATSKEVGS